MISSKTHFAYHMFIQWLAHEDALEQWLDAVIATNMASDAHFYDIFNGPYCDIDELISGIFFWDDTKYWSRLDDKWRDYVKTLSQYTYKAIML